MIDTHVHFWDIDLNIHGWINRSDRTALKRSFTLDDYVNFQGKVDGIITIEAADNHRTLQETEWIKQHIVNNPYDITIKHMAFIDVLQAPSEFNRQLMAFSAYSFVCGFRQIFPETTEFNQDNLAHFKNNLNVLHEKNHIFNLQMTPVQLLKVSQIIIDSNVRCVIDHAGMPKLDGPQGRQQWLDMLQAYAKTSVYFKLTVTSPEIITSLLQQLTPKQFLIGSNYPVAQQKLADFPEEFVAHNNINAKELFNF